MPSYFHCRAFALVSSSLAVCSQGFAEQPQSFERTMVVAANKLTSKQDLLASCKISADGSVTSCQEFTTDIPLNNPIDLDSNETSLFIVNYGLPGATMGTSFVLQCNLPKAGELSVSCKSIMAYANRAHITGMRVVGKKIFFTQSYTYSENSNFDYVVACDVVENVRVPRCGLPILLKSDMKNPRLGINKKMNIAVNDKNVFVVDHFGGAIFQCTQPNAMNGMQCSPQTTPQLKVDEKEQYVFPVALDIWENYSCSVESAEISLTAPSRLHCCVNKIEFGNDLKTCQTLENKNFFQVQSLRIDVTQKIVYLANNFNNFPESPDSLNSLSWCNLGNFEDGNTIQNCHYNNPDFKNVDGVQKHIGTISALEILK